MQNNTLFKFMRLVRELNASFRPRRCKVPAAASAFSLAGCRIRSGILKAVDFTAGLLLIYCTSFPAAGTALADEIILTTGERFTSSKVWEEDDKLRFDMQGLIVSVGMEDVAAVIRDKSPSSAPDTTAPVIGHAAEARQHQAALPPIHSQPAKPEPDVAPHEAALRDEAVRQPNARGAGLDGLAWLMKPTEIPGIEKMESDPAYGGIDQYWRPGGNLILGDTLLDGLVLGFWRDSLYSIMMWVDGKPGYERLQQSVFDRYGQGRKNKNGLERYVWLEDTTDRMLEFDPKLNTGIFWMRSRDLDRRIKKLYPE